MLDAAIREAIERPHKTRFWGQECDCSPMVVDRVWGDGQKLAFLTPLATRPNHYVLQVDSKWTPDDMREPTAEYDEMLDEVLEEIACQFGTSTDEWVEELAEDDPERYWPVLNTDCGTSWGEYGDAPPLTTAAPNERPGERERGDAMEGASGPEAVAESEVGG